MQPVVPRLAPHPAPVRMAPALTEQTPLLGLTAPQAPGDGWTAVGRGLGDAAWTFGTTLGLGAAGSYALASQSQSHAPLIWGLPLTAVTALGLTSWRLGRLPEALDLERGPPPPPLGGAATLWGPGAPPLYWLGAPSAVLSPTPQAAPPRRRHPRERLRPYSRVHPSGHGVRFRSVAAKLPRRRTLPSQQALGAPGGLAPFVFTPPLQPGAAAPLWASSAAADAHSSSPSPQDASDVSLGASERTVVCRAAPQGAPAVDLCRPPLSQSLPNVATAPAPGGTQARTAESPGKPEPLAQSAGAVLYVGPQALLQAAGHTEPLSISHLAQRLSRLALRDCEGGSEILIMPTPCEDAAQSYAGDSERSSQNDVFDSAMGTPSSIETPIPTPPPGD